jgi:hypothetical protein
MPEREALHRAARQRKALALQLVPCLAHPVDLVILVPDPLDFRVWLRIPLMPHGGFGQVSLARQAVVICRLSADCCAIACRALDGAIGRTLQIDSTP